MKPFAMLVYERYLCGETVQQLSVALGIPACRVAARIRAADAHLRRQARKAA